MVSWEGLAEMFNRTKEEIQVQDVTALLKNEMARLDSIELNLIRKYKVSSAAELEKRLLKLPEHPTWEDLIMWEGVESKRRKIKEYAGGENP